MYFKDWDNDIQEIKWYHKVGLFFCRTNYSIDLSKTVEPLLIRYKVMFGVVYILGVDVE